MPVRKLPYRPNSFLHPLTPEQVQSVNDTINNIYDELRYLRGLVDALEDGGNSGPTEPLPHDFLGAKHNDTTAAAPVTGDIITAQAGAWARKPVGVDDQVLTVVSGEPQWAAPSASPHNLLDGDINADTIAADPQAGDVVYGEAGAISGLDEVFYGGAWIAGTPLENDGGLEFWYGGAAFATLFGAAALVRWVRKPLDELVETIIVTVGSRAGASVYRASNQALVDTVAAALSFETVEFDDATFFDAGAPTRYTIVTAGDYLLLGQANWDNFVGVVTLAIYLNGTRIARVSSPMTAGAFGPVQVAKVVRCVAGDYLELFALSQANIGGTGSTVLGGADATLFQIKRT